MRKKLSFLSFIAAGLLSVTTAAQAAEDEATLIIRGEYLATIGDCMSCHNNPADKNPYSGGYKISSPLGIIYGSNITPSKLNGIGHYTLEDFSNAVRYGKAPNGHLYPAMPYMAFAGMADDDIKALYTYFIKGIDPVDHDVTQTNLGFPFMRSAMWLWNFAFVNTTKIPGHGAPGRSAAYGEYLVKTLAHCSSCHTPRNAFGAENMTAFLSGGKVGAWTAPNITQDKETGIGNWSQNEIYAYLKDKHLKNKIGANNDTDGNTESSFSKLSDENLYAIAVYIKSIPGIKNPLSIRKPAIKNANVNLAEIEPGTQQGLQSYLNNSTITGAQIYNSACATCHGVYGQGVSNSNNDLLSLVSSTTVAAKDPSNLIMIIHNGLQRKTDNEQAIMPAFRHKFTPEELQKVADYVTATFGNPENRVTLSQVEDVLSGGIKPGFLLRHAKFLTIAFLLAVVLIFLSIICYILFKTKKDRI